MDFKSKILVKRGYLVESFTNSDSKYFALKLLKDFGVEVDKPNSVSADNLNTISEFFGKSIPKSFYSNPQDLKYFTPDELLFEQLVSYINVWINGTFTDDEDVYKRVELFHKFIPDYCDGEEVVTRKYKIVSLTESELILSDICKDLCLYTRPWSEEEQKEFEYLYGHNYFNKDFEMKCKDNIIFAFKTFQRVIFAQRLDKKDVVKLSIDMVGEAKHISFNDEQRKLLGIAITNAYDCPLTKRQAKYYNTISHKVLNKYGYANNNRSPYKLATKYMHEGKVMDAAKLFASNGSLLERNLVWLLSRASVSEVGQILDLVKTDNPIVLTQLVQGIINDTYENRTFKFTKNKKVKMHKETDRERHVRKSILSIGTKNTLKEVLKEKINQYYMNLPKLGKIYLSEEFKNIASPLNTSATGSGLDVLPIGSRLPITEDYIRTFCYWNDVFDIDASALMIKADGSYGELSWRTYSGKPFGNSALSSGDDRGRNGAEYQDFKISELIEKGFRYVIYTLNGFGGDLNCGEIYCGYQNKKDLDTQAWSPKNIAMKIAVKGDSRQYSGFAIDLLNKEIVILNQIQDANNRVVDSSPYALAKQYLDKNYLINSNMYDILKLRGELVDNPEEADVVFDRLYTSQTNQQVIRPYHIEKLVSLLK